MNCAYINIYIYTFIHTYTMCITHTYKRIVCEVATQNRKLKNMWRAAYIYIYIHTHIYIHTYTLKHTHPHIYTYKLPVWLSG